MNSNEDNKYPVKQIHPQSSVNVPGREIATLATNRSTVLAQNSEGWADVRAIVRVSPSDEETWSLVELTRPYAIIGRKAGCDITIAHPDLETVHTYLHFDSHGCHAVDVRTSSGMRINGRAVTHGRFYPGDLLEVGGFRIRLDGIMVNNQPIKAEDYGENPLVGDQVDSLVQVRLSAISRESRFWKIQSSIAFIGSEPSCAVSLTENPAASRIHGVLVRTEHDIYYVDLASRGSHINGSHIYNKCQILYHNDILAIGRQGLAVHRSDARCAAQVIDVNANKIVNNSARSNRQQTGAGDVNTDLVMAALLSRIQSQHDAALERQNETQIAMAQLLRQIQNEQSRLFESHLARIREMDREIAELKSRLDRQPEPQPKVAQHKLEPPPGQDISKIRPKPVQTPPQKVQTASKKKQPGQTTPKSTPAPATIKAATSSDTSASPEFTTAWLIDRVSQLEQERSSSWKDLIGRIRGR